MDIRIPDIPRRTPAQEQETFELYSRVRALINEATNEEATFLYNSQLEEIFMDRLASGDPAEGGNHLGEIDLFGLPSKEVWEIEDKIKNGLSAAPRGTWITLRKGFRGDDGDVIYYQPMVAAGYSYRPHDKGLGLGSSDHMESPPKWQSVYDRMIEGDVAGTRTVMREERIRDASKEASRRLALQPGLKLGTLVFNDGKVTRVCEVKAVDGESVILHGRRGAQLVQLTTNALAVDYAIKRAEKEGRRDVVAQKNMRPAQQAAAVSPLFRM